MASLILNCLPSKRPDFSMKKWQMRTCSSEGTYHPVTVERLLRMHPHFCLGTPEYGDRTIPSNSSTQSGLTIGRAHACAERSCGTSLVSVVTVSSADPCTVQDDAGMHSHVLVADVVFAMETIKSVCVLLLP